MVTRILLAATLTACSVPDVSLEGKQCPCTDGYVCDTLTNRCLQTNGDGGVIDTPAATGCLPTIATETELYRYMGSYDWAKVGGTWSGSSTEIAQTDQMASSAVSYRTAAIMNVANVHVIATMRETGTGNGGTPALGIALRTKLDGSTRYRCMWSSAQKKLTLEREDNNGSSAVGTSSTVTGTIPGSLTMEALANGTMLSCCIRELTTARITNATDTALTTGFTGFETERKAAAFGSFVVFQLP